jgi:O-antigen/teichoic acid export membrane protein
MVKLFRNQVQRNKTLFKYLSSSFLSLPVSLLTGFITFRTIDPYFMGIWATMSIFETYATFMRLGIVNGMNRELPHALGAGKKETAFKYAETTLAYTLFDIGVLILVVPFLIWRFGTNQYYISAIVVAAIRIILSFYTTYLTGTFRSDNHFNTLSNIQLVLLICKLVLSPLVFLGFYWFLVYELMIIAINAILLHYYKPFSLSPKLHIPEFKALLKIGFPIFATSYLISFIETLPRLYIIKFGNANLLGLYAPVLMLLSTMSLLPSSLSNYMYPKFSFEFGQTGDVNKIFKKIIKIIVVSFLFILSASVIVYFVLDYFILFFPKYAKSLPYLELALLICPFIFFKLGNMLGVILKRIDFMLLYIFVYASLQITTLWLFSNLMKDVLYIVIYAQILTAIFTLLLSWILNYFLIKKHYKMEALKWQ